MTVLLAGAFGQGNPGDEALLAAFARALPGRRLVAASHDPAATTAEHDVAAVGRDDALTVGRALWGSVDAGQDPSHGAPWYQPYHESTSIHAFTRGSWRRAYSLPV